MKKLELPSFKSIKRNIYCFSFLVIEKLFLNFIDIFYKNENKKNYYDNIFIKIDGIRDWIYFQPVFDSLVNTLKKSNTKNLFIISKSVKPFINVKNNNIHFYYFDVERISSFSINYIFKYIFYFSSLNARTIFNLVFWSKLNCSNFPVRIIKTKNLNSFDIFDDLVPKKLLSFRSKNIEKKYYINKKITFFNKENPYKVPIDNLMIYQFKKLNDFFPDMKDIKLSKNINYELINNKVLDKIAIFPFASTKQKSMSIFMLNTLIYVLDSLGFNICLFGSKFDKKNFKKLDLKKIKKKVEIFPGTIPLMKLGKELSNTKIIITAESFEIFPIIFLYFLLFE